MNPHLQSMLQQAIQAFQSGNFQGADLILQRVLQVDSKNLPALQILGLIKASQANYKEAIGFLTRAVRISPNDAAIQYNLAKALADSGNDKEALIHHKKAVALAPNNPEAWLNYGKTASNLGRHEDALVLHDKVLSLRPDYAEAWSNKGITLSELKRFDEAIAHYDRALSLKPDIDWLCGDLLHARMKIASWSSLADSLEILSQKVMANDKAANPFALLSLSDDAFLHKKCSEIYAQRYPENSTLGPITKAAKKERIRIAYFSPDFRNHPVSFLTSELFEIHDRARFEVIAFSLQKAPIGDQMNLRLRKGFDRFIDVDDMSDQDIAQLARKLDIDIAIDLTGLTQNSRTGIFSYRAAPIQVNWLGYPGTTGADFIDYIVADKTIIPIESQKLYSEKVVSLPDTYIVDDSKRIASSRVFTREECGLPENAFVFCCFNNDYKFNSQVLDVWSRILLATKNSVLWISENNEHFRVNITAEFEKRDIDPERIIFASREELMTDHLARYDLADLFLDTHPYNAHTTAVDSLKAGVPILTLKGESFAGRVAASLLNAINLPELITNTQGEYEALAIELAMNPDKLLSIKLKLANNRLIAPLFNTPLFVKNIETAYIAMMDRYQADLQPDHISIA
jgi:predicted O-linked N-acetylglucosamine transferase (SPINDLY family)